MMMIRGLQTGGSGGSKGLIVGNIASGWTPVRNPQSKYFITEEQYSEASYPPFATGPSYLGGNQVKCAEFLKNKIKMWFLIHNPPVHDG